MKATLRSAFLASLILISAHSLAATSDEIQVYDDEISKPDEVSLDLHLNGAPSGVQTPEWEGQVPADHDFRMTAEFNYGLTENLEAGLYIPVLKAGDGTWYLEGAKARLKALFKKSELGYYWGMNFEIGSSSKRTEEDQWNAELRPIFGYRLPEWNLTINPIFGMSVSGADHTPDFTPAIKISRKINEKNWVGIEHYADYGPTNNIATRTHETYLVTDSEIGGHEINFGVGHGWTETSNKWTAKAIIHFDILAGK
ncbi:MAG: hypothetical protein ACXVCY_07190 [Pseudobdellovibrionaceae bacterium]